MPPEFAGHVVHSVVRTHEQHVAAGAIDDRSESWIRITADGQPDLIHTITTSLTGTPLGEALLTPTGGQIVPVIVGPQPTPPPVPTPAGAIARPIAAPPCPQTTSLSSPQGGNPLVPLLPPFVVPVQYGAALQLTRGTPRPPSQPPPSLPPVSNATPLKRYAAERQVTPWERHERLPSGNEESAVAEIDSAGRLEYLHLRTVTAAGQVADEIERVYGLVEVYAPSAVPADAFTFSEKACGQ